MRQTNIFWVAIFLGGLEAVKAVSVNAVGPKNDRLPPGPWKERVKYEFERWGNGYVHDIPLSSAGFHGKSSSSRKFTILPHRLRALCHQHCSSDTPSTATTFNQTCSLYRTSCVFWWLCILEWWCCLRYVDTHRS